MRPWMVLFAAAACTEKAAPPARPVPAAHAPRAVITPAPPASRAATDAVATRAKPTPKPGGYANVDPDDDLVVAPPEPREDCEGDLARAGITYRAAKLKVFTHPKSKIVCGAPEVVTYVRGPGKIAYRPLPLLTCTMALALASFERILKTEAERLYGAPVVRIDQLGTYNCREMAAYPGWVSEHSYANAIDIARFVLGDGRTIDILRDFDTGDAPPAKRAGAFLRVVSQRAHDEDVFSHVLTPFFDSAHKNHFHLDLARFRTDGTRPQ